jgi:hypothetical protein
MRLLVLLCSLLMPLVAWFSQQGAFGPSNAAVSDRYPTLVVAAGYAFAIWGLIFLLDIAYGIWQTSASRRADVALSRIAPFTAAGFALTAAWMPLFSTGLFWLCLLVIFAALGCLLHAMLALSRSRPSASMWAYGPLSLHAGWLALAAFLNLAQVIVAYRLLPVQQMLGWSLALFALAAGLLLVLNARMRGNVVFVAAATWALVGVYVKQSQWQLPGAGVAAWVALAIALALVLQLMWLRLRARRAVDGVAVSGR